MQLSQAPSRRWLLSQPRTLRRGVAFARATGEGSPDGAFLGGGVGRARFHSNRILLLLGRGPATARKSLQGLPLLSYESLAT